MHSQRKVPLTRIQKLIAHRMSASKRNKPCAYIESKADVTELMALRPTLRKSLGVKITTNAFYIRSLAVAAANYPLTVATLDESRPGNVLNIAQSINVGFAVNAPQGLVVPVVNSADKKSLAQIARLEKTLTEKARDNQLTLDQMEGETIALSNLGAYDIESFIGIVPPPTSTILSVGNVINTVVPHGRKPTVRKVVTLTVAFDRRVIGGDYAAQFLRFIVHQLQHPSKLIKEAHPRSAYRAN